MKIHINMRLLFFLSSLFVILKSSQTELECPSWALYFKNKEVIFSKKNNQKFFPKLYNKISRIIDDFARSDLKVKDTSYRKLMCCVLAVFYRYIQCYFEEAIDDLIFSNMSIDSFQDLMCEKCDEIFKKYINKLMNMSHEEVFNMSVNLCECNPFEMTPEIFKDLEEVIIVIKNIVSFENNALKERYSSLFNDLEREETQARQLIGSSLPDSVTLKLIFDKEIDYRRKIKEEKSKRNNERIKILKEFMECYESLSSDEQSELLKIQRVSIEEMEFILRNMIQSKFENSIGGIFNRFMLICRSIKQSLDIKKMILSNQQHLKLVTDIRLERKSIIKKQNILSSEEEAYRFKIFEECYQSFSKIENEELYDKKETLEWLYALFFKKIKNSKSFKEWQCLRVETFNDHHENALKLLEDAEFEILRKKFEIETVSVVADYQRGKLKIEENKERSRSILRLYGNRHNPY